jgi:hypothetical protein
MEESAALFARRVRFAALDWRLTTHFFKRRLRLFSNFSR